MHEMSVICNLYDIIEQVAKDNDLIKITKVKLLVGRMRQVVPVAMEMAFEAITKDTIADSAQLELEFVPIKMQCDSCTHVFSVDQNVYICPECNSVDLTLLEGQELIIQNIEGEDNHGN